MYKKIVVATAVAALAVPAAAQAHVTLQPSSAAAGSFAVLDVRVPTERDNASTTKIDVQFPAGFASARYEPKPGWRVRIVKKRLATPIQTDDGPITEGVSRMIWTRTSRAGGIKPNEFVDFPISVQIPGKAGDKLTFKALQTYTGGEVVRWIGAEDSDNPAPVVSVTGANSASAAPAATATPVATQAAAASTDDGNGLAIAALIVGALGLIAGTAGLLATRRAKA
jgi:periplasmic copper chaperone A